MSGVVLLFPCWEGIFTSSSILPDRVRHPRDTGRYVTGITRSFLSADCYKIPLG